MTATCATLCVVTVDPPGLRMEPLRAWLADQGLGPEGALTATLFPGGRSNLTYLVRDAAGTQRWDNSFGARLERAWPWLRSRLLPAEDKE